MKRSIYEIQNPKDYEPYFTKDNLQENIIQALANMGQRLGIKGDGIKYNSFTFKELIDNDAVDDSDNNIGYIQLNDQNNITIGVTTKDMSVNVVSNFIENGLADKGPFFNYTSVNSRLFFDNDFILEIPINNIEKYIKNSILSNDSKYFTQLMIGKYFGYDDNDKNNCEYIYNKFEIDTNKLIKAYRAFYVGSTSTNDFYCVLKLEYKGIGIDQTANDVLKYELTFQIFDTSYLSSELKTRFTNSFIYSYINDHNKVKFDFLDKKYLDDEELEKYNDDNEESILSASLIALMLNYADNKYDYGQQVITYTYNTNDNIFLYTDNADFKKLEDNIRVLYGVNIVERMVFIGNDIAVSYENLMKYFNDKYYFTNKKTLLLKILFSIYQKIDSTNGSKHHYMFIPLDYKFHYICNSENEIEIYYSNNIFVNLMNLAAEYNIKEILNYGNIIYAYNGEAKVKVYNFEIDYNKDYPDVINEIQVKDLYTLPYINAEYNWSINDKNTFVSALGKDAGNPNIIITYSGNTSENSHSILNNIYNKTQIDTEWEIRKFNVSHDYFSGLENEDSNENPVCYAWIPKITVSNIKYLYDSIIISISNTNCLENDKYAKNYNGKYIVSIWTLSEVNSNVDNVLPKYVYLVDNTENNSDIALTFGTIANNVSDVEEVNKNIFDIMLLKAKTNTLAQTVSNDNINNWIIFKNKTHNEYINGITLTGSNIDSDYNNDLNFMFQFNDTIKLNNTENNITYSQTNKYLGFINDTNSKLNVTNKAYPKYIVEYSGSSEDTENEIKTIRVLQNASKLVIKDTIYNTIDGTETISTDYIEDQTNYVDNIYRVNNITNVQKNVYSNNNYFNDYVFNDNVPNLDLKEMILKNINTLNRVNILTLDKDGNIYNSYIGCSFDDSTNSNKNILHIASNMTNINIGAETLIDEESRYNFKKQDTLSIDFDNIIFNTNNNIIANNNIWTKQECQGITFYNTAIRPIGIYETYEHSIFGYSNLYIKSLLSNQSNFGSKELLKNELSSTNSYILNELGDNININNVLNSSEVSLFLLNNLMFENENEKTNKDSIFRRINIYTNNNTNTISNNAIRDALTIDYEDLMNNYCIEYELNASKLELDISGYENVNYVFIVYPNKINDEEYVNNLGDPIKIDLENKKIIAVHYGACMVVLTEKQTSFDDILENNSTGSVYILFINVNMQESITVYTCLNINKLFKYKLGKDINANGVNVKINTKFNKLLTFDNNYYLILNNEENLSNVTDSIYYYDNELTIMYYEKNNDIIINIGFERDNYGEDYQIETKFNIIQNTVLNRNTSIYIN